FAVSDPNTVDSLKRRSVLEALFGELTVAVADLVRATTLNRRHSEMRGICRAILSENSVSIPNPRPIGAPAVDLERSFVLIDRDLDSRSLAIVQEERAIESHVFYFDFGAAVNFASSRQSHFDIGSSGEHHRTANSVVLQIFHQRRVYFEFPRGPRRIHAMSEQRVRRCTDPIGDGFVGFGPVPLVLPRISWQSHELR